MPHLIRGLIDGDGWISFKGRQIGYCGNKECVTYLRDYLVENLNVYKVKVLNIKKNLWQVVWCSKKDIQLIGDYIYKDKQDCFLQRKYDNFNKLIKSNTEVKNL